MHSTISLADRFKNLGTETVFAVSQAAADHAAKGHTVYPFHIGDVNIGAAPNVIAAQQRAIAEGRAGYVAPQGILPLRIAVADDVGAHRGLRYGPEHVAIVTGGKPVIGKFIQAVMNPGDEVLYPAPGFPIYESMIDYFGGVARPYRFAADAHGSLSLDFDHLRSIVTPKTRVLIFNNCHNPTAAESSASEIERLAAFVLENNLLVLSDDAYSEVRYSGRTHHLVSQPGLQERTVILYTFSKKFGMTGWRLGAAVGPKPIIDGISQLNLNDESCTTAFVQWAGVEALTAPATAAHCDMLIQTLRERRDAAYEILRTIPTLRVVNPECAFYFYPDVSAAMQAKGFTSVNAFANAALIQTGVSFATRMHFNRLHPDETGSFIRLSYSGIGIDQIRTGLGAFAAWLAAT